MVMWGLSVLLITALLSAVELHFMHSIASTVSAAAQSAQMPHAARLLSLAVAYAVWIAWKQTRSHLHDLDGV